ECCRLNVRKLVEHVQRVLWDGGPGAEVVDAQYTRLLLQLLGCSGWQTALPASLCRGVLQLVCRNLRQEKGDAVVLSKALHILVAEGFYQERLEEVLDALSKSFTRETGSGSLVSPQLAVLLEVCRRLGASRRQLLCSVGEPILRSLLVLFTRNSLQLKELALEFLALQLSLHHPGGDTGASQRGSGQLADEDDLWSALLGEWHALLMRMLQHTSASSTILTAQEVSLRRAQVWLLAESLHQLKSSRKPCGALPDAVDSLCGLSPTKEALPWLEVVACYLWKYPETAAHAVTSLRKLLEFLTQCYSACKLLYVKRCILLCYSAAVRAYGPRKACQTGKKPWPVWTLMWEQTIK
ncbi:unnamed protein product, partial [Ixodes hexagonus]